MSMVGALDAEVMDLSAASAQWLFGSKLPVADLISSPKRFQRPRSKVIENTSQCCDIVLVFGSFERRVKLLVVDSKSRHDAGQSLARSMTTCG